MVGEDRLSLGLGVAQGKKPPHSCQAGVEEAPEELYLGLMNLCGPKEAMSNMEKVPATSIRRYKSMEYSGNYVNWVRGERR